ncbi:hypothetical protein ASZ78_008767 [Callipepla squamata]|uniref:Ig-like domain-containing protein n=1 Tax=Callipepla squamata TaxID=9009 RepID=A0A226NAY0_CALSU|nr:hypothetical protein ASZ78_008767 [Callipepla squamata]
MWAAVTGHWCTSGIKLGPVIWKDSINKIDKKTVFVFVQKSVEELEKNKATLVCLLSDYYPSPVTVEWLVDGSTRNGETTAPQRQSNSQYMASSYLSLTSSEWSSHETYTCRVSHDVGPVEKTLKRSECS